MAFPDGQDRVTTQRQSYVMRGPGIEGLALEETSVRRPGPGEVLLAVVAVSLNYRDLMVMEGPSPYGEKRGLIPVSDGAGIVMETGPGVERVAAGDAVVAAFRPGWIDGRVGAELRDRDLGGAVDGMLTTHVILPEVALVAKPAALSFEEAACFPCAGVTAWNAVFGGSALLPRQSLLVQGTGGVSLFALQFARAAGQRVIATTSSAEKSQWLLDHGADAVVDYRAHADWEKEVLRLTDGQGVDRVVEVGGAGTLARSMACTRLGGEIAVVGVLDGAGGQVNPMAFIGRMLTVRGISVGSRAMLERAMAAFVAGGDRPTIDRTFDFAEARQALAHFKDRRHVGKVVITVATPAS